MTKEGFKMPHLRQAVAKTVVNNYNLYLQSLLA